MVSLDYSISSQSYSFCVNSSCYMCAVFCGEGVPSYFGGERLKIDFLKGLRIL